MPHTGDVPELEDLYDERTLAALDTGRGEPSRRRWQPRGRAPWGSVLVGTALGLQEVLDPRTEPDEVVELRPEDAAAAQRWVTFVYVAGAPRASRILVRPWLAPRP